MGLRNGEEPRRRIALAVSKGARPVGRCLRRVRMAPGSRLDRLRGQDVGACDPSRIRIGPIGRGGESVVLRGLPTAIALARRAAS